MALFDTGRFRLYGGRRVAARRLVLFLEQVQVQPGHRHRFDAARLHLGQRQRGGFHVFDADVHQHDVAVAQFGDGVLHHVLDRPAPAGGPQGRRQAVDRAHRQEGWAGVPEGGPGKADDRLGFQHFAQRVQPQVVVFDHFGGWKHLRVDVFEREGVIAEFVAALVEAPPDAGVFLLVVEQRLAYREEGDAHVRVLVVDLLQFLQLRDQVAVVVGQRHAGVAQAALVQDRLFAWGAGGRGKARKGSPQQRESAQFEKIAAGEGGHLQVYRYAATRTCSISAGNSRKAK